MEFEFKEDLKNYVENTDFYREDGDCIKIYKQSVEDEMKKRKDTLEDFEHSYKTISKYEIGVEEEKYKNTLSTLADRVDIIEKYYGLLEKLIEQKQKNCEHEDMKYLWHDSHYEYYKCNKCGFNERY